MGVDFDETVPAESEGEEREGAFGGPYRIHAVAQLTGVPEPTLRAWERRYGVPVPQRTVSGYRLYGAREVHQVRAMRRLCDEGMAAAEAARVIMAEPARSLEASSSSFDPYAAAVDAILVAVERFDDIAFDHEVRRAMFLGSSGAIVDRVLVPTLERIGDLWHEGELSVAQEHFASHRLGTLMRDLARLAVDDAAGHRTLVACFADEEHDIGALSLTMRLAAWGTRPLFLGARTPPGAVRTAVEGVGPKLVALSVTVAPPRARARELVEGYSSACGAVPWMVGGAGAEAIGDSGAQGGGAGRADRSRGATRRGSESDPGERDRGARQAEEGAMTRIAALAGALTLLLLASLAAALPLVGAPRPEVQLTDAWDRSVHLSTYRGMPVLVVYEDRGSARENEALKSELSVLARGDRYRTLVALVAVADVTGYDYWPIRGFVRSAIRSESAKQGTVIYCDWDGHVRSALGLERGTSNVVLYGRDGAVLYAHAGAMSVDDRRAFLALLKAQVD